MGGRRYLTVLIFSATFVAEKINKAFPVRPDHVEETIVDDPEKVRLFLGRINMSVDGVLFVRDAAHVHLVDTSPLMALNAPGTLAYHYGLLETRTQFMGVHWEISRKGGIEAVFNPEKNIKLGYQTVDLACEKTIGPKPRTEKGVGSERECAGNIFEYFGVVAPKLVQMPKDIVPVFYIMVDGRGAVEVSRPVIEDGKFTGFVVRAFVSDGSDMGEQDITPVADLDVPIDDFDVPVISRKS